MARHQAPHGPFVALLAAGLGIVESTAVQAQEPIACDMTILEEIMPAGNADLFQFSVVPDETVAIHVVETPAGQAFNPQWRLLDKNGAPAAVCGTFRFALWDCPNLPSAGSPYRIEIRDFGDDDVGTYAVNFQRLSSFAACDEVPLFCNAPLNGTAEQIADSDLFRFTVPDVERIEVNVLETPPGQSLNPQWRLLTASGVSAASCGTFRFGLWDCPDLPSAGNPYRIEVRDFTALNTGTYRVSVVQLTTICGGVTGPAPVCEIQLSQSQYQNGDTVTADVFRIANTGIENARVEMSFWLEVPTIPPVQILKVGADGSLVLPPGLDVDVGPLPLFPIGPAFPRGTYGFHCRVVDPITLKKLAEDLNLFQVP